MTPSDPRTDDSLPAKTADQDASEAADLVVAAAAGVRHISATELGRRLLAVSGTVADEDELLSLLQNLAQIAQQTVPGADSTGVTIDLAGRTYTAVHTDQRTLRVDTEQYDCGEGPCLHAAHTGQIVLVDFGQAAATWPRFAAAAQAEGILSFLAAPLITRDQTLGSLNLYGRSRSAFDSFDVEILDLLTEAVSRAIGDFARFRSARDVATGLQRALETRAPIEQAKGMLMAMHAIDADEAFARLRRESQNTNVPLRIVATRLVRQLTSLPGPATDGEAV
ncbi:GAF and ANTAR domain-containing protein [Mycobacterium sp. 141]|uniref:GAF and ANTAR domain-containing protein n=1 Tax=Mycobacterium sp. 141 TaxID=1120797 RepID=UPI000370E01C|nr:GAF and ANTAR domain-containing protein [Mycobacterium sp. 141]